MKAQAYEFATMIDNEIEALSDKDFHHRTRRSKELQEELYPLSRLGLHFKQPGLKVEVEKSDESESTVSPDGKIKVSGWRKLDFEIQITYAGYERDENLRAKLLASEGFAPGAGPIQQKVRNGPIIATMEAVDMGECVDRIASAVKKRFDDKVSKPYTQGTILLIAFDEVKLYERNWERLLLKLEKEIVISGTPFAKVYLFNGATNELRKAA